jgi:serine/threonine protein kinase
MAARHKTPRRLGAWDVLEELGRGGQAGVLKAQRMLVDGTKSQAAIKYVPITEEGSARAVELLAHEYKLLQRLENPHTAKVLDSGIEQWEGVAYAWMATELIRGTDLEVEVQKYGPLAKDQWLDLAFDVMSGLAAAHQEGVIHCDFKPANIMRDSRHSVIIDFGMGSFVRVVDPGDYSGSTPGYQSPEQLDDDFDSQDYEYPVDLFSAGATLVYAATGWLPWDVSNEYLAAIKAMNKRGSAEDHRAYMQARKAFRDVLEDTPPRLDGLDEEQLSLVTPLLAFDPRNRGSAAETLEKIRELLPKESTRKNNKAEYVQRRGVSPGSISSKSSSKRSGVNGGRDVPEKSFGTALGLATWLGWIGADRWYLGKYGSALVKTFTYGGFGIWWFVDALSFSNGDVKDGQGRELKNQPTDLLAVKRKTKRNFVLALAALIGIMIYNAASGNITVEDTDSSSASVSSVQIKGQMPDLVGLPLDEAEDLLLNIEVATVDATGDDRSVWVSSNWQVCSQLPEVGSALSSNTAVELQVVRQSEVCP